MHGKNYSIENINFFRRFTETYVLAASRHAGAISAVRKAHIRHGGEGALYVVLKRDR